MRYGIIILATLSLLAGCHVFKAPNQPSKPRSAYVSQYNPSPRAKFWLRHLAKFGAHYNIHAGTLHIRFSDDAIFAQNSSRVNHSLRKQLQIIVALMQHDPQLTARLYAYPDRSDQSERQQALAERRAHAAGAYLVSHGIALNRIVTHANDSAALIARNQTLELLINQRYR